MRLVLFTLALDAMPWLPKQLDVFQRLTVPWEWRIAEGVAANVNCTSWCKPVIPRLSRDGTSEWINSVLKYPNIRAFRKQLWGGKVEQCNACLSGLDESCVLVQCDSDEFWEPWQLEKIVHLFETQPNVNRMYFWCRYWLGKNIVSTSTNGYGNRASGEWLRAFRYVPCQKWDRHEPPVLDGNKGAFLTRDQTKSIGLVFDHFSWVLESQVKAKEVYYGYENATLEWIRLQNNHQWPVRDLREFLKWVGPNASADKVKETVPHYFFSSPSTPRTDIWPEQ